MDPYKMLGVDKNASESDIKKAYRKLAHQYHPDTGKGDEKKFKEVSQAYEILGDPQKRAQYDQFGSMGSGAGGSGFDFSGFDFSQFGKGVQFDFGGGSFGDIFDTFFGGGGRKSQAQKGPIRGDDIEIAINLAFEEAMGGIIKTIEYTRHVTCGHCKGKGAEPGSKVIPCDACSGTGQQIRVQRTPLGQIQTAALCRTCSGAGEKPEKGCHKCEGEKRVAERGKVNVKIPAGIHDKAAIRVSGKGEAGLNEGGFGDLFVHVQVSRSNRFERIGDDIHTTEIIHLVQAVMGDEITVKTIHGDVGLKVPAGTQHGQVFKIENHGVPKVGGGGTKGEHYVKIEIEVPRRLSKKEKELYARLAEESNLKIKPQSRGLFG